MTLRAGSDLVTLLRTLTMANVTALTNRPVVRIAGNDDTVGDLDSGELVITEEVSRPSLITTVMRNVRTAMLATYTYFGTSETTFKQVVEEWDRLLWAQNNSVTRTYDYLMEYDWDTNVDVSVAEITFIATKRGEAAP